MSRCQPTSRFASRAAVALCAGLWVTSDATAEPAKAPFTLSIGESVLGHTFEAGYRINRHFGIRGLYGDGSLSVDSNIEGNDYSGDVALGGFGLIVDYYTAGNTFRLSAGAVTLDHRFDGATMGNITLNGTSYSSPFELSAEFDQTLAPMIALGVQTPIRNSRLMFTGDLGLVYTGGASATGSDPTNTIPQSDIDAEISDINDSLDDLPIAPFVKIGIGFSF